MDLYSRNRGNQNDRVKKKSPPSSRD